MIYPTPHPQPPWLTTKLQLTSWLPQPQPSSSWVTSNINYLLRQWFVPTTNPMARRQTDKLNSNYNCKKNKWNIYVLWIISLQPHISASPFLPSPWKFKFMNVTQFGNSKNSQSRVYQLRFEIWELRFYLSLLIEIWDLRFELWIRTKHPKDILIFFHFSILSRWVVCYRIPPSIRPSVSPSLHCIG